MCTEKLVNSNTVTLYYDGQQVGEGSGNENQGNVFSADETTDIGYEIDTPVTPDYTVEISRFNGKLDWVQIDMGEDDHDHMVNPNQVIHVVKSWQ